jgi:predicted O-methyltransferase YrrM
MDLDLNFLNKIEQLYAQFLAHDATQRDRLNRYRNIETESAKLLNILIRTQHSKHILEIGTSTGYSTLWLAQAAKQTQGKITTLEIDKQRSEQAQKHAKDFELDGHVDFKVADALQFLQENQQNYDFVLLDAERDAYTKYWKFLSELVREKGGLLVVDNVLSHAQDVKEFIRIVENDERFITTTLAVGAGLFLVTKK